MLRVGRREVPFTHPDKRLFEDPAITKRDLAGYYEAVAAVMVPLVRGRPLALQGFPGGIDAPGFYLKAIPAHFPAWIDRATVPKRGGTVTHVLADDVATLVYLAGQNVITPHAWLSRADAPREPDRLVIDLDPAPGVTFADVRAAARAGGERLRDAGLAVYAMVTGSRGVHVVCPLRRGPSFPDVHRVARAIAEAMVADDPDRLTLEWHREERGARIFVDVNRNAYAQHAVAPYGVRPRRGGPVALPVEWDALSDRRLAPDRWTIADVPARLRSEGDPWRGIARHARTLPALERVAGVEGQRRRRGAVRSPP